MGLAEALALNKYIVKVVVTGDGLGVCRVSVGCMGILVDLV